ncbi:hypothetical protein [Actinomycetospora sp. CA-084318]|uniref:hypothetical protein n=1 Tax=Actinomycetospora sp. CA-084318 TaxID=3239892 RepID=UPI003D9564C1
MVHIEEIAAEDTVLWFVNEERRRAGVPPLQASRAVRAAYSDQLRDWLRADDPDDLWDAPAAASARARGVADLGVEVVHDRLACFDLELGDMNDPDVRVGDEHCEGMVTALVEGPSFSGPLLDPTPTDVGLVLVHQSIATDPISWRTWVGTLLVRRTVAGSTGRGEQRE